MNGYTMEQLRESLQAVRGETRVKDKEEGIRNTFLQTAADEVFQEHDWPFNERTEAITADTEGTYDLPKDFSIVNDYHAVDSSGRKYKKQDFGVVTNKGKFQLKLKSGANPDLILTYFIKAPDLSVEGSLIYFPNMMLIAERGYVRLKVAYFPDEENEKEVAASRRNLRELFTSTQPHQDFTHPALR